MQRGGGNAGAAGRAGVYDGKIAGLYDLEQTLGSGHFAVVKLARHVFTGEKVAVKVIDKSKLDDMSRSHLFQEVRCMKLVQHPNVVRLYEVIDTQTKLYLILELGDGGDLYDYIMRHESGLSELIARDYFRQIVRAISYCHRLHVVHRDLKPENVVFFERLGVVKLTDFGFSNKFCPGQKLETSCGSLAYSAPEILLGDSYDAPAVDVWSLGVILFMLVCGQAPFQEANDSETLTMIMDCKYTTPQHISAGCKKLIGRMLVRQPDKRASLSEIASDPWLVGDGNGTVDCDTPLVSQKQLSEEDHSIIVQKMVSGHIASKEQILEALEKNAYNHITATYYLLAERKLRAQRQEECIAARQAGELGGPGAPAESEGEGAAPGLQLLRPPPAFPVTPRTPGELPQRLRKCSIVREEEDDGSEGAGAGGGDDSRRGSRSEGRLHLAALAAATPPHHVLAARITKVNLEDDNVQLPISNTGPGNTAGWMSFGKKLNCFGDHIRPKSAIEGHQSDKNIQITPLPTKLVKPIINITKSDGAKTLLPQLSEDDLLVETIKKTATIPAPSKSGCGLISGNGTNRPAPPGPPLPRRHRLDCRRRRPRTNSCSSSDLSDEDSESRKKRTTERTEDLPSELRMRRRDSHDDSSDSQERGAAGGGGAGLGGGNARAAATGTTSAGSGQRKSGGGKSGDEITRRQRRNGRRETRLRESRSLNRIAEVQESGGGGGGWLSAGGLVALCGRPLLRVLGARRDLLACPARALPCRLRPPPPPPCCPLC